MDHLKPKEQWRNWKRRTEPFTIEEIKKYLSIKQNTDEWLKLRGIGSSTLASLIGLSSYDKPAHAILNFLNAYDEKYIDKSQNKYTAHGHKNEDVAANLFAKKFNKNLVQVGILVNDNWPYLTGSPDRIIIDDEGFWELVEIKCPFFRVHTTVPPNYMAQIQMLMQLGHMDVTYFVSLLCADLDCITMNVIKVYRDENYWYNCIMPALERALHALENKIENFENDVEICNVEQELVATMTISKEEFNNCTDI